MAPKVKVKINSSGARELLRSQGVLADLTRRANAIAAAAGEGHEVDAGVGPSRARAAVITESFEAMYAEATDRSLSRAIDAGR